MVRGKPWWQCSSLTLYGEVGAQLQSAPVSESHWVSVGLILPFSLPWLSWAHFLPPLRHLITSVQIGAHFRSYWTLVPIVKVYCQLKSVLTACLSWVFVAVVVCFCFVLFWFLVDLWQLPPPAPLNAKSTGVTSVPHAVLTTALVTSVTEGVRLIKMEA